MGWGGVGWAGVLVLRLSSQCENKYDLESFDLLIADDFVICQESLTRDKNGDNILN